MCISIKYLWVQPGWNSGPIHRSHFASYVNNQNSQGGLIFLHILYVPTSDSVSGTSPDTYLQVQRPHCVGWKWHHQWCLVIARVFLAQSFWDALWLGSHIVGIMYTWLRGLSLELQRKGAKPVNPSLILCAYYAYWLMVSSCRCDFDDTAQYRVSAMNSQGEQSAFASVVVKSRFHQSSALSQPP